MSLKAIPVDFYSTWDDLGEVCFKVLRCHYVPTERWCKSFSDVYALCVSRPDPLGPKLYDEVTTLMKARIIEIVDELSALGNESLLTAYVQHWGVFHRGLEALDNLFK